ncbi:hypothetical protein KY363_07900 [Candidatus Woesearchaeota archaeon]|nr:hypothetical protein [Candidatus Woesearchaeota archaeon]
MQVKQINPHYRRGITTSRRELFDLFKAWIVIGIAFAIVMNGLRFNFSFFVAVFISLLTVGVGFLFHELAHKFLAQRYGCFAEFRSFDHMLILALLMSFVGFLFAAPGAVMISGHLTRKQNGRISAAGPAMNLAVALVFLGVFMAAPPAWSIVGSYGFRINSWLALFNMIPFAMFDGKKIFDWSKPVYIAMALLALAFVFLPGLI